MFVTKQMLTLRSSFNTSIYLQIYTYYITETSVHETMYADSQMFVPLRVLTCHSKNLVSKKKLTDKTPGSKCGGLVGFSVWIQNILEKQVLSVCRYIYIYWLIQYTVYKQWQYYEIWVCLKMGIWHCRTIGNLHVIQETGRSMWRRKDTQGYWWIFLFNIKGII